jgi:hypothetical protein
MLKRILGVALALGTSALASADVVMSADIVDPGDAGVSQPPAGVLVVDILLDLTTAGDEWTAAGLAATTSNGAAFIYRLGTNGLPNLRNPNSGNPSGNRTMFATSVSNAAARTDEDTRFSFADCAIAGGYSPPSPPPATTTAGSLNVAWFRTPDGTVDVDGAVARIAITLPGGISAGDAVLTLGTTTPPASHPIRLLTSNGEDAAHPGSVSASVAHAQTTGIDWVVSAVPEPTSIALLVLGGLAMLRRR